MQFSSICFLNGNYSRVAESNPRPPERDLRPRGARRAVRYRRWPADSPPSPGCPRRPRRATTDIPVNLMQLQAIPGYTGQGALSSSEISALDDGESGVADQESHRLV